MPLLGNHLMRKKLKMENKEFTVYCHETPNGKRYVGITSQDFNDRWKNGHGYSQNVYFYKAINKYGWDNIEHFLLFEGLTFVEAEKKEIELIALWDLTNPKKGYNISRGGEKMGNYHLPESTKAKISKNNFGKKRTAEQIKKMSISHKGQPSGAKGVKWSDEQRKNFSKVRSGIPMSKKAHENFIKSVGKPVLQFDYNGVFIEEFESVLAIEKELGFFNTNISSCCSKKINSSNGYIWIYKDEYTLEELVNRMYSVRLQELRGVPIKQFTLNGEYVATYKSLAEAAQAVNTSTSLISSCCNGKFKQAKGYRWKRDICDIEDLIPDEKNEYGFNTADRV